MKFLRDPSSFGYPVTRSRFGYLCVEGMQFGLPVEGVAIILAIDQFLDMGRTATNVVGNAVATSVITKWEGMLEVPEPADMERPHAPAHTPHHGTRGLDLRDDIEDGANKPAVDKA